MSPSQPSDPCDEELNGIRHCRSGVKNGFTPERYSSGRAHPTPHKMQHGGSAGKKQGSAARGTQDNIQAKFALRSTRERGVLAPAGSLETDTPATTTVNAWILNSM